MDAKDFLALVRDQYGIPTGHDVECSGCNQQTMVEGIRTTITLSFFLPSKTTSKPHKSPSNSARSRKRAKLRLQRLLQNSGVSAQADQAHPAQPNPQPSSVDSQPATVAAPALVPSANLSVSPPLEGKLCPADAAQLSSLPKTPNNPNQNFNSVSVPKSPLVQQQAPQPSAISSPISMMNNSSLPAFPAVPVMTSLPRLSTTFASASTAALPTNPTNSLSAPTYHNPYQLVGFGPIAAAAVVADGVVDTPMMLTEAARKRPRSPSAVDTPAGLSHEEAGTRCPTLQLQTPIPSCCRSHPTDSYPVQCTTTGR